jgi:hypothetical protein
MHSSSNGRYLAAPWSLRFWKRRIGLHGKSSRYLAVMRLRVSEISTRLHCQVNSPQMTDITYYYCLNRQEDYGSNIWQLPNEATDFVGAISFICGTAKTG